ncbi:MAG: sigma-54-dependent Fis family transcriptional regulator [Desulfobacterales bacterium]|nr:sigma-54-dependent Fis family transcriptional regulator [Desulfobacterales bacterium]
MNQILLIDDDDNLRKVAAYNLETYGFSVLTAASGNEGLEKIKISKPDVVISDVKLGDIDGLSLLEIIKSDFPDLPVIIITAFGTIEMAVKAMNQGAFHFITKPFDRDSLRQSVMKALEHINLKSDNITLSEEINRITGTSGIVSVNSAVRELLETAKLAADSNASILITGESGTGKELLARVIHDNSRRSKRPMLAVNCASIPESLIESELFGHVKGAFTGAVKDRKGKFIAASGGTLFLDEITELKIDLQAKLLRTLQESEITRVGSELTEKIDVRIISAANVDFSEAIQNGLFRDDLYYRLGVIPLHLPPLRERKDDIPGLIEHFLRTLDFPGGVKFSDEAISELMVYGWPGNIRELKNTVERCVILCKNSIINKEDLRLFPIKKQEAPSYIPEIPDEGISLEEVEKSLIKKALEKAGNNQTKAAKLLKIPRHVLIYRLDKYKIQI